MPSCVLERQLASKVHTRSPVDCTRTLHDEQPYVQAEKQEDGQNGAEW